jgi:hypothetical protein
MTALPATTTGIEAASPVGWSNAGSGNQEVIAAANDGTGDGDATNATGAYDNGFLLNDMPGDFGNMNSLSIRIRYGWVSAPGGNLTWDTLQARIVKDTDGTVLAAGTAGGVFQNCVNSITVATPTNMASAQAFSYVNTTVTEADWNDARLELRQTVSKNKGGDATERRVYALEITGDYTTGGVTTVQGTAAGSYVYSGSAAGKVTVRGTAAGSYAYRGHALGPGPALRAYRTTRVDFGGAASIAANMPEVVAGDLILAVISWRQNGSITPVEAGWTEHFDFFGGIVGPTLAVYTRVATGGEPSTYSWNFSGAVSRAIAGIATITHHDGVDAVSLESSGNTASPVAPTATSNGGNRLAFFVWTTTHNTTFTYPIVGEIPRWDDKNEFVEAGNNQQHVATQEVGSGATGTRTASLGGTVREWRAVTILIEPVVVRGTAAGSYSYSGSATGTTAGGAQGTAAGSYSYSGSAAGDVTVQGSASGSYAYSGSAIDDVTVQGSASGSYAYSGSAAAPAPVSFILNVNDADSYVDADLLASIGEGSASGNYVYSGSAAGAVTVQGSASGNYAYSGAATGQVGGAVQGTAFGSYAYDGSATGEVTVRGSASSTYVYGGSATGSIAGSASGSYVYDGAAAGGVTVQGSASSTYAYGGSATGSTAGSASGSYVYDGSATGEVTVRGSASSTYVYGGSATGSVAGSASGSYGYSGSAAGEVTVFGSASSTYAYNGSATGSGGAQATASGDYDYQGSATGKVSVFGSAAGDYDYQGAAVGEGTVFGSASGTYVYSGTASGTASAGTVQGSADGTYVYQGAAAGSGAAGTVQGTASGAYTYTGAGSGETTVIASASGVYAYQGSSTGRTMVAIITGIDITGVAIKPTPGITGPRTNRLTTGPRTHRVVVGPKTKSVAVTGVSSTGALILVTGAGGKTDPTPTGVRIVRTVTGPGVRRQLTGAKVGPEG